MPQPPFLVERNGAKSDLRTNSSDMPQPVSVIETTALPSSPKVRSVTVPLSSIDCTALATRFWMTFDSDSESRRQRRAVDRRQGYRDADRLHGVGDEILDDLRQRFGVGRDRE